MADFPGGRTIVPNATIAPYQACTTLNAGIATAGSGTWVTQNLAIYIPFFIEFPVTAVKMTWINGATVNGNIDVGIYDQYGSRLVSKGSTAQSGTSALQTADITDTLLNPGNYFMAMCSDSATATVQRWSGMGTAFCQACGVQQQDLTGSAPTLPATATFANPANGFVPYLAIDLNTTI